VVWGELAASRAGRIEDGGVAGRSAVREMPLAEMQPDPFDWVQFGRIGWQPEQADVLRHHEIEAGVRSCEAAPKWGSSALLVRDESMGAGAG
jgi:hypothetical protein